MYRLSIQEFLQIISKGLKVPITMEDVFSKEIKVSHLKRIDKLFNKGLHYYLDPKAPEDSKEASVFFRKQNFANDELNLCAVKIVNQFEELKISLSAIEKLSDLDFRRKIRKFSSEENPKEVAEEIRKNFYPEFNTYKRDFLKAFIIKFAENNILVFEFIETWNKKDKANIDGFFLNPNFIVLKRHQSFSREIFTLAHELGHYLLEEEEIEELDYHVLERKNLSKLERWCNDFAYYFLIGDFSKKIDSFEQASASNDYNFEAIESISSATHLSKLALFTRLLYQGKISKYDYSNVKEELDNIFKKRQQEKEDRKQILKDLGIKQQGSVAKPIRSPLFITTIQTAYYEGVLSEYEVCKKLKIKPDKFEKYIQ